MSTNEEGTQTCGHVGQNTDQVDRRSNSIRTFPLGWSARLRATLSNRLRVKAPGHRSRGEDIELDAFSEGQADISIAGNDMAVRTR